MGDPVWRDFSRAALDAAYNNMAAVSDSQERLDAWAASSAALRARAGAECDLPHGPGDRQRLDIFRCGGVDAPLIVFIHGGWWQRNSKEVFSCMALGPMAHGCDVALLGYTLAPEASLTVIAAQIWTGLDALVAHQARQGRGRTCVVSGWSAGGHLAALSLAHPAVAGGLSISGVFDLEPIRHSYINDKLRLDAQEAARLSPARTGLAPKPFLAFAGDDELPELKRQTLDFADVCCHVEAVLLQGHDHFSILEEMERPGGRIALALASLAREARGAS